MFRRVFCLLLVWIGALALLTTASPAFGPMMAVGLVAGQNIAERNGWERERPPLTTAVADEVKKPDPPPQEPVKQEPVPETKPAGTDKKYVYLTFDDGPHPVYTPAILDLLAQRHIKATFFVVGTNVERYPELVKQIAAQGHEIGNHTYNHVYSDIYRDKASFLESLNKNDELIYRLTQKHTHLARDPGGLASRVLADPKDLPQEGYYLVGWSIDSSDSHGHATAEDIYQSVLRQLDKKKDWHHVVVLMHDFPERANTLAALPRIIDLFQERGFEFRALDGNRAPIVEKF